MQSSSFLIRTKLRQPFIRPERVARPRLQIQIDEGLRGLLTLIIAPAGFGKTTLAAEGLAGRRMPVAWLSLDREDNQTGRFISYLIAALQIVDRQLGDEAAQLASGIGQTPPEAVMTSLINDLDRWGNEVALALDDYQFIASPAVHAAVTFLLDHCPRNLHLLIVTRSDPPLPLARLRARGQLVELRAEDLRFTESEADQFLNAIMGLQLDHEAVSALEKRTEGWVAGLQMASIALQTYLSRQQRGEELAFIERFSGTHRHALDYLMEEVLDSQTPQIQQFLLNTSILERMTAPLCDAILGNAPGNPQSAAAVLKHLQHENLFLIALEDDGPGGAPTTWFRYHHLFSDLLQARLHEAQPDMAPRLHSRASVWFEQNGWIAEAIHHRLQAKEIEQAAVLIERYGPAHLAEDDPSILQMADALPVDVLVTRPKIGAYQAWLLINQGRIEQALTLLYRLATELDRTAPSPEQLWVRTFVQFALAFLTPADNQEHNFLPGESALNDIPASEPVLRDAADILYGMALGRRGEIDRSAEFASQYLKKKNSRRQTTAKPGLLVPPLASFLATIYWFQGRLTAAAALCHEYLDLIQDRGLRISTAGNLEVVLGEVLYDWNRLDKAEEHIRNALQANETTQNIMVDAFGMLALTHVLRARQDYAATMHLVDKFEARLQGLSRPVEFSEDFHTLRIQVLLESGDLQSAANWADQVGFTQDYALHPQYYRETLAQIRLAQGRFAEVAALLAEEPSQNMAGNRVVRRIRSDLLLAAALHGQGRQPEALKLAESCLALAEPEGYVRVFADTGKAVQRILTDYAQSDAQHKPYALKVLAAFPSAQQTGEAHPQPIELVEPLSEREIEVLQWIAEGKTNPEIARQLVVAPGTIKAHAASIYRKLDVNNRTEAVTRARQLGILP